MKILICSILFFVLTPAFAFTETLIVSNNGKFTTIKKAIQHASEGDTVLITHGVYDEQIFLKQDVTIKGEGAGVTKIEYSGSGPVVYAKGVMGAKMEGVSFTYKGSEKRSLIYLITSELTISDSIMYGGTLSGIEAKKNSRIKIISCLIRGNMGSGVLLKQSEGTIENSRVTGNRYFGIEVNERSVLFSKVNLINRNRTGGIYVRKNGRVEVYNTVLLNNRYNAIWMKEGSEGVISNNTIMGNGRAGILFDSIASVEVRNNIINDNGFGLRIKGKKRPISSHNNVWRNDKDYENIEKSAQDLSIEPLFGKNYNVLEGSPLLMAGIGGKSIGAVVAMNNPLESKDNLLDIEPAHNDTLQTSDKKESDLKNE